VPTTLPRATIRTQVTIPLRLANGFATTARAFTFTGLVDGREHLAARNAGLWTVAGVDGATGFTQSDGGFTAHGVAFARDRWFFLVVASGPGVDPGVVGGLAAAQAARVPAAAG